MQLSGHIGTLLGRNFDESKKDSNHSEESAFSCLQQIVHGNGMSS